MSKIVPAELRTTLTNLVHHVQADGTLVFDSRNPVFDVP
jgi:hypothetical protein